MSTSIMDAIRAAVSAPAPAESAEPLENQQLQGLASPQLVAETCGRQPGLELNPHNPQTHADAETLAPPGFPHNPHNPQPCPPKDVPTCTATWLRSQGCDVIAGDVEFIKRHLPRSVRGRQALLRAYVATWLAAMPREHLVHRRDSRGRFIANTALREGRLDNYGETR